MNISLRLLFGYRKYMPANVEDEPFDIEIAEGTHVSDLLAGLGIPQNNTCVVLINGRVAENDPCLRNKDVIIVFPAMIGGNGSIWPNFHPNQIVQE